MLKLTDSHAHLTHGGMEIDLDPMLERAQAAGVTTILNISTDVEELENGLKLSKRYPWIKNAAATTPHDVEKQGERDFEQIATYGRAGALDAIGETGLDYHYTYSPKELQKTFLRRYLALAKECNLPIVIHCRDAFEDFFSVLDEENYRGKGVLHCFTGTIEEAKEVISRGWFLSLSGIVTFKKSEELREVAKQTPLDQLFIETDAPYLAPVPYRGKQNEPAYLVHTAECIANLRGITLEDLAEATSTNVLSFSAKS
ncbi:MAG: D-aminoacyl-tRNA deacylase [Chlamydiales bacterium]|nr:D-aminoacyl-tRNA deacylase [Chlamydiales bacterium]MCH9619448.1 D-aminoacyl-tRNA deacylase [Chlamydiales bacterium]MCH9622252.1 D-aminoacyl-tRNA deacylase [Chlamydiales bacterium]